MMYATHNDYVLIMHGSCMDDVWTMRVLCVD